MIIDSHQHVMLPPEMQFQKNKEAGVDKAVLFSTTPHPERAENLQEMHNEMQVLYRILSSQASPEERMISLENALQELLSIISQYPDQYVGFGPVPMHLSQAETSRWIDDKIVQNGLKGIGEFTPGNEQVMQSLETMIRSLVDFPGYPIWVHTFMPVTKKGLAILMDLCDIYPSVPVIFGHLGGDNWVDLIDFAKSHKNAYLDLSATFATIATKMAVTELPDRCLYSSDSPYGEPFLSRQIIEYVSPNKKIANMVLGENAARLLNIRQII